MTVSVFPKDLRVPRQNKLENITLRGFGGGWNAIETDLQMESTYLVKVRNFRRTPGGTQKIRYGSKLFANITTHAGTTARPLGTILDQIYFANRIVSVTTTGLVLITDNTGATTLIWSPEVAAALPPDPGIPADANWANSTVYAVGFIARDVPAGQNYKCKIGHTSAAAGTFAADRAGAAAGKWDLFDFPPTPQGPWSAVQDLINFVPFKRQLIIHNGRDKPITINDSFAVTYLQDLGSGSNVHVPIGQYGCVVSNYHCIANINPNLSTQKPTTIFISAVGTAGTFPGDAVPNDSVEIDVGAYAPQGAIEIRGIAGFRSNLLVFFLDQTVIVKLGTYETPAGGTVPVHKPFFPDTLPTFGLLGHRCIAPVENDLLFAGLSGMASARRNLLSVSGTLESQSLSERISPPYKEDIGNLTDDQQRFQCWQVYDPLSNDMLLFTPFNRVFVYSFSTKLRYSAWSEYSGITATCGCRSFLGRVFYSSGTKIYLHGNNVFANEEFFQDHISDSPTPIDFEMELPWLDSKNPMQVKFLRFVGLATKGDGTFTMSAFVDNLYKDVTDTVIFSPAASMEFVGNDASISNPALRRSGNPRLYKFPCKFKTLKVRLSGSMGGNLEIVNMSFLFNRGKYRR